MIPRLILISVLFLTIPGKSFTQTDSLFAAISQGEVHGYWRSFFMATDNEAPFQDWYALATGGFLKYETKNFHHFKIGIGFYYSQDLISNVTTLDTTTGKASRYELGLFDVNDASNREIPILGEIYLQYGKQDHHIKMGRFKLKSPFLNPEDGRMIPTLEQGIWYQYQPDKKLHIQLGWLTHIGARSTAGFMPIGLSIGSYPQGKNTDGQNHNYGGNLISKGIGIISLKYEEKKWGLDIWNYYVENIFNTFYIQPYFQFSKGEYSHKIAGQFLNQLKVGSGGNSDPSKAYVQDNMANTLGLKYQISTPRNWIFSANWNYVTDDGRFLFPREWGREFLFVFQKRERLEGVRNTHAWMLDLKKEYKLKNAHRVSLAIGYGRYYRPDAKDFLRNKYAMPANEQINLDVFWYPNTKKTGLRVEWLTTYKRALGNTYNNPNFILNKVGMLNHNLILNYQF